MLSSSFFLSMSWLVWRKFIEPAYHIFAYGISQPVSSPGTASTSVQCWRLCAILEWLGITRLRSWSNLDLDVQLGCRSDLCDDPHKKLFIVCDICSSLRDDPYNGSCEFWSLITLPEIHPRSSEGKTWRSQVVVFTTTPGTGLIPYIPLFWQM